MPEKPCVWKVVEPKLNYSFINDSNNTNDSITTPLDGNIATSAIDKDYNKLLQERANM